MSEEETMDEQRPVCSKCDRKLALVETKNKESMYSFTRGWKHECECVEDLLLDPDYIVRI
jgi:hypothetical protein